MEPNAVRVLSANYSPSVPTYAATPKRKRRLDGRSRLGAETHADMRKTLISLVDLSASCP